jgi:hypothetical protein
MYDGPGHDHNGRRVPSAFHVANGILTCTGTANGDTGGMAFAREEKYCRVEWRVRTYSINPKGSGHRYHPVLIYWPTSDEWPQGGEFDFYECDCDSGKYEAYLHIPGNDGSAQEYVSQGVRYQPVAQHRVRVDVEGNQGLARRATGVRLPRIQATAGDYAPDFSARLVLWEFRV